MKGYIGLVACAMSSSALEDLAKKDVAGGFVKLVEKFKVMEKEREKIREDFQTKLTDHEFNCKKRYDELDVEIADATEARDEAAENEATARDAAQAAKEAMECKFLFCFDVLVVFLSMAFLQLSSPQF